MPKYFFYASSISNNQVSRFLLPVYTIDIAHTGICNKPTSITESDLNAESPISYGSEG